MITKERLKQFIMKLEIDYFDETNFELLVPRNNREYWLFTEIHQRLNDLLEEQLG